MQVNISTSKCDSGDCANLFHVQSQESGESSVLPRLSGLIAIYDPALRNASPALVVARGVRTWELKIASTTTPRRGVLGTSSEWVRRARIVGERESIRKS